MHSGQCRSAFLEAKASVLNMKGIINILAFSALLAEVNDGQ